MEEDITMCLAELLFSVGIPLGNGFYEMRDFVFEDVVSGCGCQNWEQLDIWRSLVKWIIDYGI